MKNNNSTNVKGAFPIIAIIGVIIALLVVVGAAVVLTSHSAPKPNTTTTTSSSSGSGTGTSTTPPPSNGNGQPNGAGMVNATCGPGYYCLSQTEMASLLGGTGGNYYAVYGVRNGTYGSRLSYEWLAAGVANANLTAVMDNVTGVYLVGYNQSNKTSVSNGFGGTATLEFVFQGPRASWIYSKMINGTPSTQFNVTNATINGLTYSYIGVNVSTYNASQGTLQETLFYGYKDKGAVFLFSLGRDINGTQLATKVAGDIP